MIPQCKRTAVDFAAHALSSDRIEIFDGKEREPVLPGFGQYRRGQRMLMEGK